MKAVSAALLLVATVMAGCASDGRRGDSDVERPVEEHGPGFEVMGLDARGLPVPYAYCLPPLASDDGAPRPHYGQSGFSLACEGGRRNAEMTPDEGRHGNEVTIAVNPKDPRNIVGGAKDYYPMDAGQCVWDGIYVTHDGGATEYEDRNFDGSPWRLLNDPASFRPNYASSYWCTTDPVAYFDVHGTFYYLLMAYQTDPVTGSKLGEDQLPMGALNDWAFNRATQIVAISSDGGDSFHTFTPVLEGSFPVSFHDKGWIAAGPDGVIHVMWLAVLLPGNLYFRSTDGGKTFSDPEVLATTVGNSGQGSFVDVGTGSQVYAMWTSDSVYMRRSLDSGATWDAERPLFQVNDAQHPGLSPRDRVTGFPALATDRNPDSPLADALYVIWHDACNDEAWRSGCDSGASGVYVRASFDQGETWGDPVRVSGGDTRWRMLPALSVSPGGVLDASWMEHTDERIPAGDGVAERARMRQMYSYSLDGGATWSEPVDIRDAGDGGWDPAVCRHQNGMVFLGDYNDIDSSWQAAHPVWPDARHGVCDVFTATMQRPMFAQGWDAAKREAAEQWIRGHPLT